MASTTLDRERRDLLASLTHARAALTATVRRLSAQQLGEHPTVSELCLGGLVKHVTSVEVGWRRFIVDGPSALAFELPDGVTWDELMTGTVHVSQLRRFTRAERAEVGEQARALAAFLSDGESVRARVRAP